MNPCDKCHQAIKSHCLTLNRRLGHDSLLCGGMEVLVNNNSPLKEKILAQPNENFTRDYNKVLADAHDPRITREQVDGMSLGPKKLISALLFFSIGPTQIASIKIPRSDKGIRNWVRKWTKEE